MFTMGESVLCKCLTTRVFQSLSLVVVGTGGTCRSKKYRSFVGIHLTVSPKHPRVSRSSGGFSSPFHAFSLVKHQSMAAFLALFWSLWEPSLWGRWKLYGALGRGSG